MRRPLSMPLQDLTPQLRTRLSRLERLVGWFVLLAAICLAFGFGYYLYHTAQRKGWFVTKAPYFTLIDRATGLKVGDPVKLMGFEVGRITRIEAQPPEDFYYNVYVEFEIRAPHYGYLWTAGSRVRVTPADFLGKRELEVTKGNGGTATYMFHPLRQVAVEHLAQLPDPQKWLLAEDIYEPNEPVIVLPAQKTTVAPEVIARLRALGRTNVWLFDSRETRKSITAVWNDRAGRFEPFTKASKPYWLRADETPALTERLDQLVEHVEKALPGLLGLTNLLATTLSNAVDLTANLNAVALNARPAVSNLTALTAGLHGEGALGAWLLPAESRTNLALALAGSRDLLTNANLLVTHADASLLALTENLARSLDNLAGITSNLNRQVDANTNILSAISDAVRHTDELVQGLKRHWLLRSAFRQKTTPQPATPPSDRLRAPKSGS